MRRYDVAELCPVRCRETFDVIVETAGAAGASVRDLCAVLPPTQCRCVAGRANRCRLATVAAAADCAPSPSPPAGTRSMITSRGLRMGA